MSKISAFFLGLLSLLLGGEMGAQNGATSSQTTWSECTSAKVGQKALKGMFSIFVGLRDAGVISSSAARVPTAGSGDDRPRKWPPDPGGSSSLRAESGGVRTELSGGTWVSGLAADRGRCPLWEPVASEAARSAGTALHSLRGPQSKLSWWSLSLALPCRWLPSGLGASLASCARLMLSLYVFDCDGYVQDGVVPSRPLSASLSELRAADSVHREGSVVSVSHIGGLRPEKPGHACRSWCCWWAAVGWGDALSLKKFKGKDDGLDVGCWYLCNVYWWPHINLYLFLQDHFLILPATDSELSCANAWYFGYSKCLDSHRSPSTQFFSCNVVMEECIAFRRMEGIRVQTSIHTLGSPRRQIKRLGWGAGRRSWELRDWKPAWCGHLLSAWRGLYIVVLR
jgi:hypothetical protein